MQVFTMSTAIVMALASLSSASPIEVQSGDLARRATSAVLTKYSIQCTSSSCSYSATAHILPEDVTINFTGSTSGPTILPNQVIYTPSNPSGSLTLSRTTSGEYFLELVYQPLAQSPSIFSKTWPSETSDYSPTAYLGAAPLPLKP